MRNNAITVALMLATFSIPSIVHAADPKLEKLSSVQADIILLQAQNDREELIQKLKKMREKPVEEPKVSKDAPPQFPLPAGAATPPPPFSMPAPFAEIAKAEAEAHAREQAQSIQAPFKEEKVEKKVVEKPSEVPVLRGVVGAGSKLFATVAYESGQELDATVGDQLPGGFTVLSLSVNKLTLKDKGGKKIELLRSVGGARAPATTTDSEPQSNVILSAPPARAFNSFPGAAR
jgi:type IV pilus biogenesis protein PilP